MSDHSALRKQRRCREIADQIIVGFKPKLGARPRKEAQHDQERTDSADDFGATIL